MAAQEAEYSLENVVHGYHMHTYVFGLPDLVSNFHFVPIWVMSTICFILFCFGDKRCRMVGHIQRIICSTMITVFM